MRATFLVILSLALPLAQAAHSGEGASTAYLNVRSGAGTGNPVVGGLVPGDVVQILRCDADAWCQIAGAGQEGWVASRFLTASPSAPEMDPRCRWELDITLADPEFRAACPAGVEPPPPPPPPGDLACLYERENYGGARTCLDVGEYPLLEAGLAGTFSSVQLQGAARVRLCTGPDLGGICMDWLESSTTLDRRIDDATASVKVYVGYLPPPPPPPPVVHSEGNVALSFNGRVNLDSGAAGPAGADLWLRRTGDGMVVAPVNGAQVSLGSGADRTLHECRAERFDERPLAAEQVAGGAVVCVQTNMGRFGRILATEGAGGALDLTYVTWGEE